LSESRALCRCAKVNRMMPQKRAALCKLARMKAQQLQSS
jgi:hypothetical protein